MTRRTIAREIVVLGTALHAGTPVSMTLCPVVAGSGIVFRRSDLGVDIPARYDLVSETRLGTVLSVGDAKVGVVEHLLAACAGAEIDDLEWSDDRVEPRELEAVGRQVQLLHADGRTARPMAAQPRRQSDHQKHNGDDNQNAKAYDDRSEHPVTIGAFGIDCVGRNV